MTPAPTKPRTGRAASPAPRKPTPSEDAPALDAASRDSGSNAKKLLAAELLPEASKTPAPEAVPAATATCEVTAADIAKRWNPPAWAAAAKSWTQAAWAAGSSRLILLAVCVASVGLLAASLCVAGGLQQLPGWAGLRAAVAGHEGMCLPGAGAICGALAVFTLCAAATLGWHRLAKKRVDETGDEVAKAKRA